MSQSYRARQVALDALLQAARAVSPCPAGCAVGGVDYSGWDWGARPVVVSMAIAQFPMRFENAGVLFHSATLVITAMRRVAEAERPEPPAVIAPEVVDRMASLVEDILSAVVDIKNDQGDPCVARVVKNPPPSCREFAVEDGAVQGVEVTATVEY